MSRAYLLGALHDSTERKYTFRISQKFEGYVERIANVVNEIGFDAWTYREGRTRDMYVVEFNKAIVENYQINSVDEKRDYIRGYFDTDGSVPKDPDARLYVYFAQRDKDDLLEVKQYLEEFEIETGTLHQPSKEADSEYWRFYVLTESHADFAYEIGSWHPRKSRILREKRRSTPRRESGIT